MIGDFSDNDYNAENDSNGCNYGNPDLSIDNNFVRYIYSPNVRISSYRSNLTKLFSNLTNLVYL